MKKRIISSILVVVMLVLSLASCGYSYSKDDMGQYMTFDQAAFEEALENLNYDDGDFTTNEETRKEKIAQYIYKLLTDRVGTTADKLTEGKMDNLDKVYYRYYATYEKDGTTVYVYPSKMVATSASENISLGDTTLTNEKKVIRDEILKLIEEGKLDDIKGFVYEPKTTPTADTDGKVDAYKEDTAEGTVAYISYTKEGTDGPKTYSYERVVLGDEDNYAASALVNSKIGTALTDNADEPRKNTEDGVEYTYTSLKVNCTIPADLEEIVVTYKLPSVKSLTKTDFVSELDSYDIPADTVLTYHVALAYFNDVEDISADLIMKELLAKLPTKLVEDEDGHESYEERELPCFENAADELEAFEKALANYNSAKSAHETALKSVTDAETKLETANKNNTGVTEATKALEDAKADAAKKEEELGTADTEMESKLTALYQKVDSDVEKVKATVVDEFEVLVRESLIDEYNDAVKTNIAKSVWAAMLANASVTSHPEKAVKETYNRMLEVYQNTFYNGTDSAESVTYYSKYGGEFSAFLIAEMKGNKEVPDAENFVTDYTQAKHALWYLAKQYVSDIIVIYYVADLYDLVYDASEIRDFKNADDRFFDANEPAYGENNILAAHQFDGVMDYFLEIETDANGEKVYFEEVGAPDYKRVPDKFKKD